MLRVLGDETRLCDGGREVLRLGGVGALSLFGGLGFEPPAAASAPATPAAVGARGWRRARSVIFFSL